MPSRLTLPVPKDFELFKAVCSYGHFMLAPSQWDRDAQQFHRVLRDGRDRTVRTRIRQPGKGKPLVIHCDRSLDRADQSKIKREYTRMLRVDADVRPWYRLHKVAGRRGFGRLYRGPNLFEDIIKTITNCNVTWRNTIMMNKLLVEHVGHGGYPTPHQLADFGEQRLKDKCKVGYRAGRIIELARKVADNQIDLDWYEQPERTSDEVYEQLQTISGIGPYAAANIAMLLGFYDRLAIDTETYRHYCKTYNVKRPKNPLKLHKQIEKHYNQYAPYPFLAYWFELWRDYESRFGPSHKWHHTKDAHQFTAAALNS